jgi:hypothetical protein
MVYIGIDLHRKRSQVAALDERGELLFKPPGRNGTSRAAQGQARAWSMGQVGQFVSQYPRTRLSISSGDNRRSYGSV